MWGAKRDTRGLTGVTHCEGTPVPAVKVSGGICVTPGMVCNISGSSFSLNISRHACFLQQRSHQLLTLSASFWCSCMAQAQPAQIPHLVELPASFLWPWHLTYFLVISLQTEQQSSSYYQESPDSTISGVSTSHPDRLSLPLFQYIPAWFLEAVGSQRRSSQSPSQSLMTHSMLTSSCSCFT